MSQDNEHTVDADLRSGRRRRWTRLLAAMAMSAILVALLSRQTSLGEIAVVLASSDRRLILLGFAIYAVANWFKGLRFRLATSTDRPVTRLDVYETTCLYNMATGLLPFGAGEISYPYLMRRWHDVGISQSTPALVVTRLFDLIMVSLIFLVSALVIRQQLAMSSQLIFVALVVLAAAIVALILAPWMGDRLLKILESLHTRWSPERLRQGGNRVLAAGHRFIDNLRQISNIGQVAAIGFYSFLIWGISYLVFLVVIQALGYDFNYWMAAFCASLALMTNLLPIQGIAGLGVREVGWILGLTALGFSTAEATTLAFSIHAVTLSYLILLGLLAGLTSTVRRSIRRQEGIA
ncbi:MAG: lysylphosphatidylglycerol synthase transmembrane domain-containing protein [Chloroflexota bacterium]|nr:lysylphosphatidylglycerol synthase transmembrane domain-containing protein [Chloroflexota bacterium]